MPPRDRRTGAAGLLRWTLIGLCAFGLVLMVGIAGAYSPPNEVYGLFEGIGACLLAALAVFVWWFGAYGEDVRSGRRVGLVAGALAGLIWVAEIAYNNFVSPRSGGSDLAAMAAGRDRIDDLMWAAAAVVLLAGAGVAARRAGRWREGFYAGAWGGVVSGLVACLMALSLIAFWMPVLTSDPLNTDEFARRPTAMSIERYLAAETMAGALLHLVLLGLVMGGILGAGGGLVGLFRRDGQAR